MTVCHAHKPTVFILLVLAGLAKLTVGRFRCPHGQFKSDVVRCYTDQGIQADAIFSDFRSSDDQDITTLLASLMASNGDSICSQADTQSRYRDAVRCVYKRNKDCQTTLTRDTVANPNDAAKMVDPLCENRQDIDFGCVKDKSKTFHSCAQQEQKNVDKVDFVMSGRCHVTNASAHCVKTEYKACGCGTAQTYSDIVYDLLQPTHCLVGNDTAHRVVCDPRDQRVFVWDGLNAGPKLVAGGWAGVWAVVVLAVWGRS